MKSTIILISAILSTVYTTPVPQNAGAISYSSPFQNSFAFTTPNLQQSFTTKLAAPPGFLSNYQAQQQEQQVDYANLIQQQQQLQQQYSQPQNVYANNYAAQQAAPQVYDGVQQYPQNVGYNPAFLQILQQQANLAYQQQLASNPQNLQQVYQPQRSQESSQQQQEALRQQINDANAAQTQADNARTNGLIGVAFSPATQVSQIKFKSGKVSYEV